MPSDLVLPPAIDQRRT